MKIRQLFEAAHSYYVAQAEDSKWYVYRGKDGVKDPDDPQVDGPFGARRHAVTAMAILADDVHEEDQEQRDNQLPKGEYDLRKMTRNPDRRGARVPPVYPDRPPRKS